MLRLKVNGQERVVEEELDPAIPLLWVLRDYLGLVGSKYGCGAGFCGACTVQLNGAPVRSCSVLAAAAADMDIVTIEGLASSDDHLHPLQQAWIDMDVPQCGYCQAGQLMSAAALLRRRPIPSDADIDAAMSGNLCRCATYLRIRAAIHRAAEMMAARVCPAGSAIGDT
jgi:isoquinoline 1-oxidoreductase alpha subunit